MRADFGFMEGKLSRGLSCLKTTEQDFLDQGAAWSSSTFPQRLNDHMCVVHCSFQQ